MRGEVRRRQRSGAPEGGGADAEAARGGGALSGLVQEALPGDALNNNKIQQILNDFDSDFHKGDTFFKAICFGGGSFS